MAEHPHTSVEIESGVKDSDSTLASRTKSLKINVVTPYKKYKTDYHQLTQLF